MMPMEEKNTDQNHISGLNPAQTEAVLTTEGPLLIIAGAGAGKTKTLTHRILHIIREGTEPSKVLAITFTNKAAKEMRERVMKLLAEAKIISSHESPWGNVPFVSTFHSLGVKIIKDNAHVLGLTKHFGIFDRSDSLRAIKEGLRNLDLDPKLFEPGKILNIISREKGNGVTAEKYYANLAGKGGYSLPEVAGLVWRQYEEILGQEKALDFDDLLLQTVVMLENHPDILKRYQDTWHYIHIDEYQDTNKIQYKLAKLLTGERMNICVVGDVDQNIYSWRGADIQNILRFEKDYAKAKIIKLEENYRSTKTIISVANTVIEKNKTRFPKTLFTNKEDGEKITVFEAFGEAEEARFIACEIKKLVEEKKVEPQEIAVLYRANFQSRVLEEALISEGVSYQLLGTKFFERAEVKNILSYLKAALNPDSLGDVKRIINIPARGLGKVAILKIFSGQREALPKAAKEKVIEFYNLLEKIKEKIFTDKPEEVVKFVITETGLDKDLRDGTEDDKERLENMKELATLAVRYNHWPKGEGIEKMLEEAALASDQDEMEKKENAARLMTVHSAKGLEFDYVFITGLEEDLFPHQKMGAQRKTGDEEEEERRLFYVALTRARKKLYLTHAKSRTIFGSTLYNSPSRFLEDIDPELIVPEEEFEYREKIIYLDL
jgi:DNA helicase-2/ATP-dependent DNA helicase PcrA